MKYELVNQNHPRAMRLQHVGNVLGTPASEIKVGSVLMWNFGHKSLVKEIKKETGKSVVVMVESTDGALHERRLMKSRLVCILQPK